MKPILIDDLIKDNGSCQSGQEVMVDGVLMQGYQIAKPLNYDPNYFRYEDRIEMAIEVLKGKAIAVRYFDDLSEEEKAKHIKKQMAPKKEEPEKTLTKKIQDQIEFQTANKIIKTLTIILLIFSFYSCGAGCGCDPVTEENSKIVTDTAVIIEMALIKGGTLIDTFSIKEIGSQLFLRSNGELYLNSPDGQSKLLSDYIIKTFNVKYFEIDSVKKSEPSHTFSK